MAKKATLTTVGTGWLSNTDLNADLNALNDQFDNTLSLDGSTPNAMGADLDMNSNDILNVGTVAATEVTVGGTSIAANVAAAAASAAAASASETAAAASETNAAASETNAAASAATIAGFEYLGEWQTSTAYVTNNIVYVTAGTYTGYSMVALSDHTSDSSSFDTDYTGGKWGILAKVGGGGAGTGDLLAANNLSDLANAATSRTNLGVAIGTDVQAYDAGLASIAGLTTAANKMVYTTASDTYAVTDLTSAGRAILDDADASAQRTTLGLGTAAVATLINDDSMATATASNIPSAESVVAYVTANAGSMTQSATDTDTTSGTAVDLTGIASGAKMIVITGKGVSTNGTSKYMIQLGDSGGFETTGYTCQGANTTINSGLNSFTTGFPIHAASSPSAATAYNFEIILKRHEGDTFQWSYDSRCWTVGLGFPAECNGEKALSAELTQIRLTTAGGTNTFDAGSIQIGVLT